jgi:proton glutamate symport protein
VLALIGLILLTYVVAVSFGRVGLGRFARAAAPAQVVAFSTQSSLACLPAMVERARDRPGRLDGDGGSGPAAGGGGVPHHLDGRQPGRLHLRRPPVRHHPGPGVLWIAGGLTALAISVGTVGLPGQVSFFASIAPIALAMGLPLEVLPLLLAVEVVPDIFRTVGNVTADLAAARIVEGRDADLDPEPGAGI